MRRRLPAAWGLFGCGVATAALGLLLARSPGVVERVYAQGPGPVIARTLARATGWAPVSVALLLLLGLLAWAARRAARGLGAVRRGEVHLGDALRGGARWSAGVTGAVLITFYVAWGFNYARAPLDLRLGLQVPARVEPDRLARLAAEAVARSNAAYLDLHEGEVDVGVPTPRPPPATVSRDLRPGWSRVAAPLGLPATAGATYGPVKTAGTSRLLRLLDIRGVYSPFTGEAHVDGAIPGVFFGAVAAHEHAHQRGIARENEATFAGLLAAVHAPSPYLRYSAWTRIAVTLLADLRRADPAADAALVDELLPGVRLDLTDHARWVRENRGPAGPVATRVNDAYLKAHAVPGGVANYGRVTELLLAWAAVYGEGLGTDPGSAREAPATGIPPGGDAGG